MQKGSEAARDLLLVSLLFLTDDVVPAVPHSGPHSDVFFIPPPPATRQVFSSCDKSARFVVTQYVSVVWFGKKLVFLEMGTSPSPPPVPSLTQRSAAVTLFIRSPSNCESQKCPLEAFQGAQFDSLLVSKSKT